MPGLDDALERLVNEPGFRDRLQTDPQAALAGFDLSRDDLEVLAHTVDGDGGSSGSVEARQSKSALFGMISQLGDALGDSAVPTAAPSGPRGDALPEGTHIHDGAAQPTEQLPEGTYIHDGGLQPVAEEIPEGTRVHDAELGAPGDETPEGLWVPDFQPDAGPESV